jgi:DNA polymerase-3 subunit chi
MRVDFYQLSRDPAEAALPLIARATLKAGERLLVVSSDDNQLLRISEALWSRLPESFLAHGASGGPDDLRQPILLSDRPDSANGARYMAIADGVWREGEQPFERVFYLFDEATLQPARDCWRMLGTRDGLERKFWKQQDGKWVEGP